MKDQSLTQVELAERIGVTQAAVSKWINGTVPKGDQLLAIANALGVNMEWLLSGKGPKSQGLRDALGIIMGLSAIIDKISHNTDEVAVQLISDAMSHLEADFLERQALPSDDRSHLATTELVAFFEDFRGSDHEACLATLEQLKPIHKLTPGFVDLFDRVLERLVKISTDPDAARAARERSNEIAQSADARNRRLLEHSILSKREAGFDPGESGAT